MKVNLVLKNASVYTVNQDCKWAHAIAIADKKIVFVGANQDVETYINSDTVVMDLDGKMVLPAFVDSHMHPALSAHLYQYQLVLFDLAGKDQIKAYLNAIRDFSTKNPDAQWIIGDGYSGRDHNMQAFSSWMAGGGIKGGTTYGKTDEFDHAVVENPVSVHDLHATILRLLGIDHTKQTFRFQGRRYRLTDVHGNIQHQLVG